MKENKELESKNIRDIIRNSAKMYPNNKAFIIKEKVDKNIKYKNVTYAEFEDQINFLGTALIDKGLKNKPIAIIGKNKYEWALTYISTLSGVGITVPLDKGLPEQEIELSLQRSHAEAIVFEKDYIEIVNEIRNSGTTNVKEFICMEEMEGYTTISELLKHGSDAIENGDRRFIDAKIDNEGISAIIFTSGTTSLSKAVMLSQKNITSNIMDLISSEKIYPTDVNLAFLPLHHTFGSTGLLFFLSKGVTNVFCDGLRHIQDNLKEYNVTVFVCVPLLLEAMYKKINLQIEKQGKTKLIKIMKIICNGLAKIGINIRRKVFKQIIDGIGGNLRFIISGASAIDKNVAKGFNEFGILTVQGYGLTETSPVLSAENETHIKYGSVGIAMPSIEIKTENSNEDNIGEIIAKGPNIMLGYYENEEATNEVIKDGWFHTGDLGYVDKDGFIFITGRKKNVIVLKNGKNVYPEEIELLISNLPYTSECMVFGMPKEDDYIISAKIVYNKEYIEKMYNNINEEQLKEIIWKDIKEINKTLAKYKHIKNIVVTDEPMIKTSTAKVKRYEEIKKMN